MQFLTTFYDYFVSHGAYANYILFFVLLACGFGLPIPEDISLIIGGILAARGFSSLTETNLILFSGVLIGDCIVFSFGYHKGYKIKETRFYKRIMPVPREIQVLSFFQKYGDKVIFIARFLPGLRTPLFFTAGLYKTSYVKFFALDGFAALISVPVWIWIGYTFGNNWELLEEKIKEFQTGSLIIIAILIVSFIATFLLKKRVLAKIKPPT